MIIKREVLYNHELDLKVVLYLHKEIDSCFVSGFLKDKNASFNKPLHGGRFVTCLEGEKFLAKSRMEWVGLGYVRTDYFRIDPLIEDSGIESSKSFIQMAEWFNCAN